MSGRYDDHLDVLPGWLNMQLLPQVGEVFDDDWLWGGLCDFATQVLGEHRSPFCGGDRIAVVAIALPDAAAAASS